MEHHGQPYEVCNQLHIYFHLDVRLHTSNKQQGLETPSMAEAVGPKIMNILCI